MATKKEKKNWSRYSPPYLPSSPSKPTPTYTKYHEEILYKIDSCETSLSGLELPEGVTWNDVSVRVNTSQGYYDSIDTTIMIVVNRTEEVVNNNYDKQMKQYEKDYVKHKEKLANAKQERKEWKKWCEQQKIEDREANLKRAEKLLREAGRL